MSLKTLLKSKKHILEEQKNKYEIPKIYKKAEVPFLQNDRNNMYEEMNYKIDKEIGEILQQLYDYESDKYSIGIHRTASPPKDIFKEGIKYDDYPDIHEHVQIFDNFPFMLREISHAEGYKLSNGAFIIKVPKTSIKGSKKDAEPIYYRAKDGQVYLRPEFICAYVPVFERELKGIELNKYPHNIYDENTEFLLDDNLTEIKNTYGFINIFIISILLILTIIFIIIK